MFIVLWLKSSVCGKKVLSLSLSLPFNVLLCSLYAAALTGAIKAPAATMFVSVHKGFNNLALIQYSKYIESVFYYLFKHHQNCLHALCYCLVKDSSKLKNLNIWQCSKVLKTLPLQKMNAVLQSYLKCREYSFQPWHQ